MEDILVEDRTNCEVDLEENICFENENKEDILVEENNLEDFAEDNDFSEEQCNEEDGLNDCVEPVVEVKKGRFDNIKFNRKVGVYVKVNSQGFITDIGSDIFIKDLEGWQKIDEGEGDKYVFAQTQYFGTLVDEKGNYKFKKQ